MDKLHRSDRESQLLAWAKLIRALAMLLVPVATIVVVLVQRSPS